MDDLFDFNLFQTPFVVDNMEYMIFNQWLVQINSGEFVDGITLKGKDADGKFLLFAFDKENRTIVPIPINTLNSILIGLKNIPFPSKLSKYAQLFETLPENNHRISKDCFLKLSDQISALVTSVARNIPNERIECEMIEHLRTTPNMLVISAFDGITTTVYLEIQNESLQLIKPWGILSKISFYKDNNFIGEYYTQKCDVKNNSTMSFLCQPKIVSVLERRKMSGMKISGVNVYELSDFIVSSAGLSNSVHFPPEFTQCQKWYTVIIPVLGLEVSNSFGMGCVEFFAREDQAISRILDFEENFDAYKTFALAHVNSEKMYSAFQIGKQQIEQTLDLLINLLKDDSLFSIHSLGKHLLSRDIDFFERKVELAPWVYIETPFNNAHLSYNFQDTGNPSPLQVSSSFLELIPEIQKAELLLIKATGTNDEEITPLFNSLKWIRKSWETSNFEDKIINIIIALEFIVSKEPNVPMMSKSLRKACIKAIEEVITNFEGFIDCSPTFLNDVSEKFHRAYTETPFMVKLRNLIARLEIPVTENEYELITLARKHRNDIIHGRSGTLLPTDDIYRLCECVGRIALYKINSLEA